MDLGAGIYLYSQRLFIGISSDQITRDYVSFGSGQSLEFDQHLHYFVIAGYKIQLSKDVTLTPATLVKVMTPAPLSVEGSLQIEYKEWLFAGISYRHQDALVGMIGMNISDNFKFGYSFDFGLSSMQSYSAGGHELILGLMIGR